MFIDRDSDNPNYRRLRKISGTSDDGIYEITRNDNNDNCVEGTVRQEGTPLNAENLNNELNAKLDKTQVQNATGSSTSNPISQDAVTQALNGKVGHWNVIYIGTGVNLSVISNGIYFLTKVNGGASINVNGADAQSWIIVKNDVAIWCYSLTGAAYYYWDISVIAATVSAGVLYVFKFQ